MFIACRFLEIFHAIWWKFPFPTSHPHEPFNYSVSGCCTHPRRPLEEESRTSYTIAMRMRTTKSCTECQLSQSFLVSYIHAVNVGFKLRCFSKVVHRHTVQSNKAIKKNWRMVTLARRML